VLSIEKEEIHGDLQLAKVGVLGDILQLRPRVGLRGCIHIKLAAGFFRNSATS